MKFLSNIQIFQRISAVKRTSYIVLIVNLFIIFFENEDLISLNDWWREVEIKFVEGFPDIFFDEIQRFIVLILI